MTSVNVGDIILMSTPGRFYAFGREMCGMIYDHAVVVIDEDSVLHIGPPVARRLSLQRILLPKRQPVVLRPRLNEKEKRSFVNAMADLEGCHYDLSRYNEQNILNLFIHLLFNCK